MSELAHPPAADLQRRCLYQTESPMADAAIHMDFESDWCEIMRQGLLDAGYSLGPSESPNDIGYKFFSVMRRRIPPRPRKVHEAGLFSCPSKHEAAVRKMCQKAEAGEDLTPFQTRFVLCAAHEDPLLNHWDVHHFHLGIGTEPDGFTERTNDLLYARVTPDDFYVLGIFDHHSWSCQQIVQIMHDNWPESIAIYRLRGVTGLATTLSDADVKSLRAGGVLTPVQANDGTVYAPLGGGYSTAGTSTWATMMSDRYFLWMTDLESWVRDHIDDLIEAAKKRGITMTPTLEFHLRIRDDDVYAVENGSKMPFKLGQLSNAG